MVDFGHFWPKRRGVGQNPSLSIRRVGLQIGPPPIWARAKRAKSVPIFWTIWLFLGFLGCFWGPFWSRFLVDFDRFSCFFVNLFIMVMYLFMAYLVMVSVIWFKNKYLFIYFMGFVILRGFLGGLFRGYFWALFLIFYVVFNKLVLVDEW